MEWDERCVWPGFDPNGGTESDPEEDAKWQAVLNQREHAPKPVPAATPAPVSAPAPANDDYGDEEVELGGLIPVRMPVAAAAAAAEQAPAGAGAGTGAGASSASAPAPAPAPPRRGRQWVPVPGFSHFWGPPTDPIPETHSCRYCDRVLSSPGNLTKHLKTVHGPQKRRVCRRCNFSTRDVLTAQLHSKNTHRIEPPAYLMPKNRGRHIWTTEFDEVPFPETDSLFEQILCGQLLVRPPRISEQPVVSTQGSAGAAATAVVASNVGAGAGAGAGTVPRPVAPPQPRPVAPPQPRPVAPPQPRPVAPSQPRPVAPPQPRPVAPPQPRPAAPPQPRPVAPPRPVSGVASQPQPRPQVGPLPRPVISVGPLPWSTAIPMPLPLPRAVPMPPPRPQPPAVSEAEHWMSVNPKRSFSAMVADDDYGDEEVYLGDNHQSLIRPLIPLPEHVSATGRSRCDPEATKRAKPEAC